MEPRLLFDLRAAGHALSLPVRDILHLVNSGELPMLKVRGRKLIHRNALIDFANKPRA
jgi:hypothetical protein